MLRVLLTIVLPLLLPTVLYLAWLRAAHWSQAEGDIHWAALPWIWLGGAGILLLALVLFVVSVHYGTSTQGVYVPPTYENGRIVPGHIEPGGSR